MQRSNWNQIGSPTTSSNCVTTSTTNQQRLWPSGFPRHQPAMVAPHPPPAARHRVAGRPGRRGRSAGAVAQPGDRRQRWPQSSSSEDLAHGGHGQRLKLNFVEVGSNMVPIWFQGFQRKLKSRFKMTPQLLGNTLQFARLNIGLSLTFHITIERSIMNHVGSEIKAHTLLRQLDLQLPNRKALGAEGALGP